MRWPELNCETAAFRDEGCRCAPKMPLLPMVTFPTRHTRSTRVRHHLLVLWCGAVVWGAGLCGMGTPAQAQASFSCEQQLDAAEERYVEGAFDDSETLVRECLMETDLSAADAVAAYRLLTLISLRKDDVPQAKQAAIRLLGVSFTYAPDPVNDPPAYVALVNSVKDQLRVEQVVTAPPDSSAVLQPGDIQIVRTEPEENAPPANVTVPVARQSGLTKWLMIGGGVVAASLTAALLTSGGSSSSPGGGDPLPPPPGFPR